MVFKEDIEQEMIQARLDEEREVCVADRQEMEGNEEQQQHQRQTLDQVENSLSKSFLNT